MKTRSVTDQNYIGPGLRGLAKGFRQRIADASTLADREIDAFIDEMYRRACGDRMLRADTHADLQEERGICAIMATGKVTITVVSDHTIARWYQRGVGPITDDALLDDLARVATVLVKRKNLEGDSLNVEGFQPEHAIIPPPHGTWRGLIEPILDSRDRLDLCLNIRTFV
jgi:hypothetical protein